MKRHVRSRANHPKNVRIRRAASAALDALNNEDDREARRLLRAIIDETLDTRLEHERRGA